MATYINANTVNISSTTFQNNTSIINVDLRNTPFINNNMHHAFSGCSNLHNVYNISNSITNLQYSFFLCSNVSNIPTLPSEITDMTYSFYGCSNLKSLPTIPNTVTSLHHAFDSCNGLTSTTAPTIPHSVTDLTFAFNNTNITEPPTIPNSVTNLYFTFGGTKITNAPDIPSSVTNIGYAFYQCYNLTGDVKIYSNKITSAVNCFGAPVYGSLQNKNVYIPYRNSDNSYSSTYNAFSAEGYDEIGTKDKVYLKNINSYLLTIEPTPSNATVTLTAPGYTQVGNTISVDPGTIVSYTVSYPGLQTVSGTYVVNSTELIYVTLTYPSGTVLFESSTPGNYNITPLTPVNCNVICVGGGAGGTSIYGGNLHVNGTAAGYSGGGSGGYSNTNVSLGKTQYNITVGSGGVKNVYTTITTKAKQSITGNNGSASSLSNLVYAGGGTAGTVYIKLESSGSFANNNATATAGIGGSGSTANGNNGGNRTYTSNTSRYTGHKSVAGGASVYGGYGAGGNAEIDDGKAKAANGTAGYVKIVTL